MKHEWRKKEKGLYIPKPQPELITLSEFQFLTINGAGNPNSSYFSDCIGALYSVAYAIKMTYKKRHELPDDYIDWTVYPLEGVWDISDKAKANFNGIIDKNELVFTLMIRQPSFVTQTYFEEMLAFTKQKKPHPLLENVKFQSITEGKCIQMLHIGSYDDEPNTFAKMETFAEQQNVKRVSKMHREIYLSDFRKVPEEKLKTVLRFGCV